MTSVQLHCLLSHNTTTTTTPYFSFFYVAPFSFQPIFLSIKVSFFTYILVIFFLSSPLPFSLPTHTPTHSGMLIISIYITPSKAVNLYSLKWFGLRKVRVFIFSLDSFFLLPSWVSGVIVRRQGSEKRKETKEGRKKRDSTWLTKLGNEYLFLLYFFYLFFSFFHFMIISIGRGWGVLPQIQATHGVVWKKGVIFWGLPCDSWDFTFPGVLSHDPFLLTHYFLCLEIMSVGFVFPLSLSLIFVGFNLFCFLQIKFVSFKFRLILSHQSWRR